MTDVELLRQGPTRHVPAAAAPAVDAPHAGAAPLEVVHFQRRSLSAVYSVERLFDDVRGALPTGFAVRQRINRFPSRGVFGRLYDALAAGVSRGRVNHVLGDVHYLAWFLPRRRTVLTVLDCVSLERLRGLRRFGFWLLWYWWPLRHAARVTVLSQYGRDALLRCVRYPAERIHVIPPPLSGEFRPMPPPAATDGIRLLQVGSHPNKNLPRVIEAVAGLPVTLVIVGAVTQAERRRMEALGIAFEAHMDLDRAGLLEQYRRASVVVFASTYEGFGLPIIEAQAVGRPVLTSNVSAMPEAAGDGACLVDPFDVADIRRGLHALLEEPGYADALVRRGYANAARYAPERIANEYAAIYRALDDAQERNG